MDIFGAIGNTPLVELKALNYGSRVRIFGKLEGNNPGGSVKDRPAYYMIKKAEESGELIKGRTIFRADLRKYGDCHSNDRSSEGLQCQAGYAGLCKHGKKPHS